VPQVYQVAAGSLFQLLQMVKMMVTVVVIYALCWLPLHCVTLAGDTNPDIWSYRHVQVVWIASHWLAMSNCCYNPFVYFWMSSNFRSAFRRLYASALCRGRDDVTTQVDVAGRVGDRLAARFADLDERELTTSPDLKLATRPGSPSARHTCITTVQHSVRI